MVAYAPQNWVNGSTGLTPINADRLLHLEAGIVNASDRASHVGTQTAATIADLQEVVSDFVSTLLVAGAGVSTVYDDTAGTLTITSTATGGTGGSTDTELVLDTVFAATTGTGAITVTTNDAANTMVISTTATARSTHTGTQLASTISDFAAQVSTLTAGDRARANHTGTQLAATISDFTAAVSALMAAYVVQDTLWFNAKDHGVKGDNVTDDTAALNAVADLAASAGVYAVLFIPRGSYKITGPVSVTCSLEASQATLNFTGTSGAALVLGSATSGVITRNRDFHCPLVVCPTQSWGTQATPASTQGIVANTLNACNLWIPYVKWFAQGVRLQGIGSGFVYNNVFIGELRHNRRQMILDSASGGWCNSNTVYNGHWEQTSTDSTTTMWMDDTATATLQLGVTTGAYPNNNTFVNCSFEGNIPSYYRMSCQGSFNKFYNCRWEKNGGQSRVYWGPNANFNVIDGGYDANALVETFTAGSTCNVVQPHRTPYVNAYNSSGQSIANGDQSTFATLTGWQVDSVQCAYSGTSGEWTPRQGTWRITATIVVVTVNTASDVNARLLAGNTRVLDVDNRQTIVNGRAWLKLSANAYFNGTEPLEVQVRRDATYDRPLYAAGTNGCVLYAEYLGG